MNKQISDSPPRMGRKPIYGPVSGKKQVLQKTLVGLTPALRARIDSLVGEGGMGAFIREAIEEKLARQEGQPKPKKPKG